MRMPYMRFLRAIVMPAALIVIIGFGGRGQAIADPSESVLWSFGAHSDGQYPYAGLLADARGNLYGTTLEGGTDGHGTVFELTPPQFGQRQWSERVLWSFGADSDGVSPLSGLLADARGNLYGTTELGGTYGDGTVFRVVP